MLPYPRMSVHDNLAFGLKLRKFSERGNKEAGARQRPKFSDYRSSWSTNRNRFPSNNASASRLLARSLFSPRYFFSTNRSPNLEPKTRGQMRNEIRKLHQRLQATMIYATHDPSRQWRWAVGSLS